MKLPQGKRPELKTPPVLVDLFNDLRDRRLLPLLALVIVAIVAVPFLLGGGAEEEPGPSPSATPSTVQSAENARLTVVEATPGLRDYRKRLRGRVATNPFEQRYTAPVVAGAKLQSVGGTASAPASSTSPTSTEPSPDGGSAPPVAETPSNPPSGGGDGGKGGPPPDGGPPGLRFYTWTIDLRIAHTERSEDGSVTMSEPVTREGVRSLTPLPGPKAPVVTFIGVSPETGRAILMVSKDVTAVFGDSKCVSGTDSCELLEVDSGFPTTFVYGPGEVRYKLNILDIELVRSGQS